MNIDPGTLCILGIIVLLALFILPRLFGGSSPFSQIGGERPTYDDPDITSRGGIGGRRSFFGRSRGNTAPRYDSPDVRSRGGFGGSRSSSSTPSSSSFSSPSSGRGGGARKYDDPNVKSRSGFGGSKK